MGLHDQLRARQARDDRRQSGHVKMAAEDDVEGRGHRPAQGVERIGQATRSGRMLEDAGRRGGPGRRMARQDLDGGLSALRQ